MIGSITWHGLKQSHAWSIYTKRWLHFIPRCYKLSSKIEPTIKLFNISGQTICMWCLLFILYKNGWNDVKTTLLLENNLWRRQVFGTFSCQMNYWISIYRTVNANVTFSFYFIYIWRYFEQGLSKINIITNIIPVFKYQIYIWNSYACLKQLTTIKRAKQLISIFYFITYVTIWERKRNISYNFYSITQWNVKRVILVRLFRLLYPWLYLLCFQKICNQ